MATITDHATPNRARNWWETTSREDWRAVQTRRMSDPTDKAVRDLLRCNEEAWAMHECRSVGVKRTVVYR